MAERIQQEAPAGELGQQRIWVIFGGLLLGMLLGALDQTIEVGRDKREQS